MESVCGDEMNQIYCGDSHKTLKKIPSDSIDLVFTSPPYNFKIDYDKSIDDIDWAEYYYYLDKVFIECCRVLKWGGRLAVNLQPHWSGFEPTHHKLSQLIVSNNPDFHWRNEIMWEKNNYKCNFTAWGSWKSPSSPHLKHTWEYIEVFSKGVHKKQGIKENADITADDFKQWVNARWVINPETRMKNIGHPAMFPEELARRIIQLFSFKGDVVLDPFNGAGTTTLVSKKLGRPYIGIDISERYCQIAEERLNPPQQELNVG